MPDDFSKFGKKEFGPVRFSFVENWIENFHLEVFCIQVVHFIRSFDVTMFNNIQI